MGETSDSFLRTRRDKTSPGSIGLDPVGSDRRILGLRHDELAHPAGISVSYYTRIEQDQVETTSGQVLEALASVVCLDIAERIHLYNLTGAPTSSPMSRELPEVPHPRVLALSGLPNEVIPVVVLGRRGDILAWNRPGHELLFGHLPFGVPSEAHRRSSVPYLSFMGPMSRDLCRNWEDLACIHVVYLRPTSGRYPRDARLAKLTGEFLMKSTRFVGLQTEGDIADYTMGNMLPTHPGLRHVGIGYQVWQQPKSSDYHLEVYTPSDRSSRETLDLLKNGRFPPRVVGVCERATL